GCCRRSRPCRACSTPARWWSACGQRWRSPWSSSACRSRAWRPRWTSSVGWPRSAWPRSEPPVPTTTASCPQGTGDRSGMERVAITTDADVVRVRQTVRGIAAQAGLSLVDQTKVITAASELARNTLIHGLGGEAAIELVEEGRRRGVRICFSDHGPGIPDLDLALQD